jgi:DNA-binding response OmpR family regulator
MDILQTIYVEDDEQEAFVMRIGMRRQQIDVVHIDHISLETISQLQEHPFHQAIAIIFDSILRNQNGLELACQLRQQGDQRAMILLTAGDNPDPARLKANDILYLRKPPNFEQLAQLIRQHTER